jgi:hypothetical protein
MSFAYATEVHELHGMALDLDIFLWRRGSHPRSGGSWHFLPLCGGNRGSQAATIQKIERAA